jgi:hypothetical protein
MDKAQKPSNSEYYAPSSEISTCCNVSELGLHNFKLCYGHKGKQLIRFWRNWASQQTTKEADKNIRDVWHILHIAIGNRPKEAASN